MTETVHIYNRGSVSLPEFIRRVRKRRHLTQDQLAQKAGIATSTVQRIEWEELTGTVYTLSAILGALGYDLRLWPKKRAVLALERKRGKR
jgi:transcriptional regulator with XRE-family HTH domain